jgi:putative ABC transport system permease protein
VALTVMVASFRDSVAHWLDRVLPADLYVRSAGQRAGARVAPLPAGLTEAAAGLPGVAQVMPQRVTALQLDARQAAVALLSRPIDLQAGAAALAAALPLVGDALAARPGCINVAVSEALAALYDTRAGQVLALPLVFEATSRPADPGASTGHGADRAGRGSAGPNPATGASSSARHTDDAQHALPKTGPCAAPRNGHVEVYIRAVWRDYARQQGAIVMDRHDWLALGGDGTANDLAIWLQPGASVSSVQAALRRLAAELQQAPVGPVPPALAASAAVAPATTTAPADALADENTSALEFATPGEIRALSLAIFDRSFVVTRWLQLVAIALGLVGVAASFSAQVLARRKEFGALQHLGMTRRQLLWLVAGEGALWCGLGALLGLALGLVISVILVHVVNPQSFHWSMELALPWPRLFALVATVLAAGSLAALLSGRAAASRQMALAVKEDW